MTENIVSKYQARKARKTAAANLPLQNETVEKGYKPKKALPPIDPNRKPAVLLRAEGQALLLLDNGSRKCVKVVVDKIVAPNGVVDAGVFSAANQAIYIAARQAGIRGKFTILNGEKGFQYKPFIAEAKPSLTQA